MTDSSRKRIVFFLGAGASANFGYPLTSQIMPKIISNLDENNLFAIDYPLKTELEKKQEKILKSFLNILFPGMKTNKKNLPNITEILSLVDYCCFYNVPPHPEYSDEKLLYCRYLLNRALTEVLIDDENLAYSRKEQDLLNQFIEILKSDHYESSIITTNYDLSIDSEYAAHIDNAEVDFGIPYRDVYSNKIMFQAEKPVLRYYKLHGSLSWAKCDLCGYYYISPFGKIAHQTFRKQLDDFNTCICSDNLKLKTVLVAPSMVRDIRDSNLLQIWKGAMDVIRTADKIVFIGYSLPAEDIAIKSIIMRGINSREVGMPAIEIDVVQLGDSAKHNYINLFGNKISYESRGLEYYLNRGLRVRF